MQRSAFTVEGPEYRWCVLPINSTVCALCLLVKKKKKCWFKMQKRCNRGFRITTECHSCEVRVRNWSYNSHRHPNIWWWWCTDVRIWRHDSWKHETNLPGNNGLNCWQWNGVGDFPSTLWAPCATWASFKYHTLPEYWSHRVPMFWGLLSTR